MQMNEGLDTGDMIQKVEVPITEDETGESLHDKLAEAGAKLCVETLKAIEDHTATFEKQGESPTEYARRSICTADVFQSIFPSFLSSILAYSVGLSPCFSKVAV